jgi:hypothetical protein
LTILFLLAFGGLGASIAIGGAYFWMAHESGQFQLRLATASYAPAASLLFVAGMVLPREFWVDSGRSSYLLAQAVPAAMLLLSVVRYPGRRRLHLILVPIALVCWAAQFIWAQILIYGM